MVLEQAVKPPELNPETEESLPSRRSPEGPDPPVLTEVTPTPPSDSPPDLESVEKKMDQGRYNSLVSVHSFFLSFLFWGAHLFSGISAVLTNWNDKCVVCCILMKSNSSVSVTREHVVEDLCRLTTDIFSLNI